MPNGMKIWIHIRLLILINLLIKLIIRLKQNIYDHSIGAKKIFDKSQYPLILKEIHRKLGIKGDFLNFINYIIKHDTKILLNIINDTISKPLTRSRVRQRYPPSLLILNIIQEVLANKIRQKNKTSNNWKRKCSTIFIPR